MIKKPIKNVDQKSSLGENIHDIFEILKLSTILTDVDRKKNFFQKSVSYVPSNIQKPTQITIQIARATTGNWITKDLKNRILCKFRFPSPGVSPGSRA